MDFETIQTLKKQTAWRLLCIDNSSLVIGFLKRAFVDKNKHAIGQEHLIAELDDYLYDLQHKYGQDKYSRSPKEYLQDWANEQNGFLRKYYPEHEDQASFDLTSATEKAIEWVDSLQEKSFIGTESRLLTVIDLLKSIVSESIINPKERIKELEQQKQKIDNQISALKSGQPLVADGLKIRERYFQAEETAKSLLRDFRQVENNFRKLDKITRDKITLSDKPKGALLDEIFGEQNQIEESDQGRSFNAFMQLLMSNVGQQELDDLTEKVTHLKEIQALNPDPLLLNIKNHLIGAGDKVKRTSSHLVEQLRVYLDDQVWLENQRVVEIIKAIEKRAIKTTLKLANEKHFSQMRRFKPDLNLPMLRKLYRPSQKLVIKQQILNQGKAQGSTQILFEQHYVDSEKLQNNIERCLQKTEQIDLIQICDKYPIKKGLSELVAYFNIATKHEKNIVNRQKLVTISYKDKNKTHTINLPQVIFCK